MRQDQVQIPFILVGFPREAVVDVEISEDGSGLNILSDTPPVLKNENHVVNELQLLKDKEEEDILEIFNDQAEDMRQQMDQMRLFDNEIETEDQMQEKMDEMNAERERIENDMY